MSLSEFKELYTQVANQIEGWEKLSRNDCANKYLEFKDDNPELANCYFAALVCKFWNIAYHNFFSQDTKKLATEHDCYDILIDGILKALKAHVWTDPSNSLYGDVNGPEKAINVCLVSTRINFWISLDRQKRKLNKSSYSLDTLEEESSEGYYLPDENTSEKDYFDKCIDEKIRNYFNEGYYMISFVLYAILYMDLFTKDKNTNKIKFNYGRLKHYIKYLSENDLEEFAKNIEVEYNIASKVNKEIKKEIEDEKADIDLYIKDAIEFLKKDEDIINLIGVENNNDNRFISTVKLW